MRYFKRKRNTCSPLLGNLWTRLVFKGKVVNRDSVAFINFNENITFESVCAANAKDKIKSTFFL